MNENVVDVVVEDIILMKFYKFLSVLKHLSPCSKSKVIKGKLSFGSI